MSRRRIYEFILMRKKHERQRAILRRGSTCSQVTNYRSFSVPHCRTHPTIAAALQGYVVFKSGRFKSAPRVIVGITGMHTDKESDLCIAVDAVEVTREGMNWRFDGMGRTDIASVGGSFVALA